MDDEDEYLYGDTDAAEHMMIDDPFAQLTPQQKYYYILAFFVIGSKRSTFACVGLENTFAKGKRPAGCAWCALMEG